MRTRRIPSTVMMPTRRKSFWRTSWTSASWVVDPPRYAVAPIPNAGASPVSVSRTARTVRKAAIEYGSSTVVT